MKAPDYTRYYNGKYVNDVRCGITASEFFANESLFGPNMSLI